MNGKKHHGTVTHDSAYAVRVQSAEKMSLFKDPVANGVQKMACAVIFNAAKGWVSGRNQGETDRINYEIREFFRSDDYDFWASLAGIDVSGEAVLEALERNGGVDKYFVRACGMEV